jgi:hypothetical protein
MKRLVAALAALLMPTFAYAQAFSANYSKTEAPSMATSAHSSGQALGGLTTVAFFQSNSVISGFLGGVTLTSAGASGAGAGTTQPIAFYIYTRNPVNSTCTDGQTFVEHDTDAKYRAVPPFVITPAAVNGSTTTGGFYPLAVSLVNEDSVASQNLYVCMVAGGAITPGGATSDISFKIWGVRD